MVLSSVPEPHDDAGQRSRGTYMAGTLAHHLTVLCNCTADNRSIRDLLSMCSREYWRKASLYLWCRAECACNVSNLQGVSEFHTQKNAFWTFWSKWNWQFDGGVSKRMERREHSEHIQWCQERGRHVLSLMFGNRAEPLMEDRGAGAIITDSLKYAICQVNMLQHRPDVIKSHYYTLKHHDSIGHFMLLSGKFNRPVDLYLQILSSSSLCQLISFEINCSAVLKVLTLVVSNYYSLFYHSNMENSL